MTHCLLLLSDPCTAGTLARLLRAGGLAADVGDAALSGLALLHAARLDALLTDARLPGISRHQLLRAVRRLDPAIAIITLEDDPEPDDGFAVLARIPPSAPEALLDQVRVAGRDRIVALADLPGTDACQRALLLRRAGYAVVPVTGERGVAAIDGLATLAALVAPGLDAVSADLRARHPGLAQLKTTEPLPVLLAALDRLHRARRASLETG